MSVSLTLDAVRTREKTVTRRHVDTWRTLKPGDRLTLIEKGMGLPKGATQVVVAEVEVVDVRDETLRQVTVMEVVREGLWATALASCADDRRFVDGDDAPVRWFRRFWSSSHGYGNADPGALPGIPCRRIEWRYLDDEDEGVPAMTIRNDIRRIAGSLGVLGTELEQKGTTAYDVLFGWEPGPRPAPKPGERGGGGTDTDAEDRRQQQKEAERAGGKLAEFASALKALDDHVQHLNRLLDMACPADMSEIRNKRTGEFDPETALDVLASGHCPNCWLATGEMVRLTTNSQGIRYFSDRCRPCGEFRSEHGIDKPKPIVVAHNECRRLSPADVDRYIAAARAALAPAKKKKGKRGRRAA